MAREALSARIDGEREPVPAARVDEHVAGCSECRQWHAAAFDQASTLRSLASPPVMVASRPGWRNVRLVSRVSWRRWALAAVGAAQLGVAGVQAAGLDVGLSHHGMPESGHLLNESTAWSLALGSSMLAAAAWPAAAAGLAAVLGSFAVVLTAYVVADAVSGAVTAERVLTHAPILLGTALALLVWRGHSRHGPHPDTAARDLPIHLPRNASRGQRRGHLWPADGAA